MEEDLEQGKAKILASITEEWEQGREKVIEDWIRRDILKTLGV